MSLRHTIQELIRQHHDEIVNEGDWFYALDNYEVNVHDWDEDGVYEVQVYPRSGCLTDWGRMVNVPSLAFIAEV